MVNTYQLGPNPGEMFVPSVVDKIVRDVVTDFVRNLDLSTDLKEACTLLSDKVRNTVVEKSSMKRHKIISHCLIFKDDGQTVRVASKCLADKANDNYSSFTMKTDSGFVVCATVFAFYRE